MGATNLLTDLMYCPETLHTTIAHTTDLNDGVGATISASVTGAALGDFVLVAPASDLKDMLYSGYVQSANTVEVRVQNESGNAITDDITFNVAVIPRKR